MALYDEMVIVKDRIDDLKRLLAGGNMTISDNKDVYYELMSLCECLEDLKKKHRIEYSNSNYKPTLGDGRYFDFPNKKLIDYLRILYYEKYDKDLSVTYQGNVSMFSNDMAVFSNKYSIRGVYPYILMISSLDDKLVKDFDASIMISISSDLVFKSDSDDLKSVIDFVINYMGHPINFIFSDAKFQNISFARISDKDFYTNMDASKNYYKFIYDFFDSYYLSDIYKNVIFIGPEMYNNASQNDIVNANKDYILRAKSIIAKDNNITVSELELFNEKIKRKILE